MPQIGGAPGRALASATVPEEVTMAGMVVSATPKRSRREASQAIGAVPASTPSVGSRPVMAALVRSVTWARPSVSCQMTQVSRVPKRRSRRRPWSKVSSSQASLVADSLGARRRPWPCSSRQVNTVRRSCQLNAGPTGSPVTASQTTVVPRWLVTPTPSTGPASAKQLRAASSRARAAKAASSSTFPGVGRPTGTRSTRRAVTVPSGRTTPALTALLPTSITRMLMPSLRYRP